MIIWQLTLLRRASRLVENSALDEWAAIIHDDDAAPCPADAYPASRHVPGGPLTGPRRLAPARAADRSRNAAPQLG